MDMYARIRDGVMDEVTEAFSCVIRELAPRIEGFRSSDRYALWSYIAHPHAVDRLSLSGMYVSDAVSAACAVGLAYGARVSPCLDEAGGYRDMVIDLVHVYARSDAYPHVAGALARGLFDAGVGSVENPGFSYAQAWDAHDALDFVIGSFYEEVHRIEALEDGSRMLLAPAARVGLRSDLARPVRAALLSRMLACASCVPYDSLDETCEEWDDAALHAWDGADLEKNVLASCRRWDVS